MERVACPEGRPSLPAGAGDVHVKGSVPVLVVRSRPEVIRHRVAPCNTVENARMPGVIGSRLMPT